VDAQIHGEYNEQLHMLLHLKVHVLNTFLIPSVHTDLFARCDLYTTVSPLPRNL